MAPLTSSEDPREREQSENMADSGSEIVERESRERVRRERSKKKMTATVISVSLLPFRNKSRKNSLLPSPPSLSLTT